MIGTHMMTERRRRDEVVVRLERPGRTVVALTSMQIANFAGNALELQGVRRQHSLDRIGEIRKGGFLAHRSHTGSADETEIRDAEQVVRTGCEGHPPSDAEAIFG
jgi:hypothetical protein